MTDDIKTLMSAADWWETIGYIAAGLVLVGVIIESYELYLLIREGKLREKAAEFIGVLILVVGLAVEIIAQVQSNNRTGLIIAALNEQAAKSELALERLKGPRHLSEEQQKAIAAKLERFAPLTINLLEFDGHTNSEVIGLGKDLQSTIERLPGSRAAISIASSITSFASGIIIRAPKDFGDAIAEALTHEGLSVVWPSDNVDLQQILPERYDGEMADHATAWVMIARKP
jgi:hypothetical protein